MAVTKKTQTRVKRPTVKRRALSDHAKRLIERRKEVQRRYYHRTKKLTAAYFERQEAYKRFAKTGLKTCNICGEDKTADEFYPSKTGAFQLTQDCRECRNSISLENYYRRTRGKR